MNGEQEGSSHAKTPTMREAGRSASRRLRPENELSAPDGRAPRVFIAVPTRDMTAAAISGRLALLLVDLARRPDAPAIEIVPGYPVDRVRNQICKRFLESDADCLLMIDDDVVPPASVLDMAQHDKDVVAGLCYAYLPRLGYYSVAYPSGNSEDFAFCRKARAAGFSIWLDTDQPCGHYRALDMHASVHWAQEYAARQRLAELDL